MLKIISKIDLNSKSNNSHFYAKYIPLYHDEGCSCHYGSTFCGESYDFMKYPIGYLKVDVHGNFIADVNESREDFNTYTDGRTETVNHDWLRECNFWYNEKAFEKYPKK